MKPKKNKTKIGQQKAKNGKETEISQEVRSKYAKAMLFHTHHQYEKVIEPFMEYFQKHLEIARKKKHDVFLKCVSIDKVARLYYMLGQYEKHKKYFVSYFFKEVIK